MERTYSPSSPVVRTIRGEVVVPVENRGPAPGCQAARLCSQLAQPFDDLLERRAGREIVGEKAERDADRARAGRRGVLDGDDQLEAAVVDADHAEQPAAGDLGG